MSTLEEIYYLKSEEFGKLVRGTEYGKLTEEINKLYDKLFAVMNDEQKKWLDQIWFLNGGLESERGRYCFRMGFKTACRLMLEVIKK